MAAHMQARMQQRQGSSQQVPGSQMGPFGGPGSFPFYGELHGVACLCLLITPCWSLLGRSSLRRHPNTSAVTALQPWEVSHILWCDAGMSSPNFPMSNPSWPQMGSGMTGGSQGPRPPLYPGAGSNASFDPVSAAYYANLGNQQMAAAMAAAAVRHARLLKDLKTPISAFTGDPLAYFCVTTTSG